VRQAVIAVIDESAPIAEIGKDHLPLMNADKR
jgi:hypothetical protein